MGINEPQATKELEVYLQTSNLERSSQEIQELVKSLSERLSSVRSSSKDKDGISVPTQDMESSLAKNLQLINGRLRETILIVNQIFSTLEI